MVLMPSGQIVGLFVLSGQVQVSGQLNSVADVLLPKTTWQYEQQQS